MVYLKFFLMTPLPPPQKIYYFVVLVSGFFIYPLKNIFRCKFVVQSDGCLIPRCLSTVGNSGEKLLFCQSLLFVSHCFVVRNLDGKREQLCFRVQFCFLLRYLRGMRQSHKETYGLPLLFISSFSK